MGTVPTACNTEVLASVTEASPPDELIARVMMSRSEITHPVVAADETVFVVRLLKKFTKRALKLSMPDHRHPVVARWASAGPLRDAKVIPDAGGMASWGDLG